MYFPDIYSPLLTWYTEHKMESEDYRSLVEKFEDGRYQQVISSVPVDQDMERSFSRAVN
jgi:hypothetical protein